MAKIKKVNVLSLARSQAVIFMLLGLLAGIIYSFGGLIVDTLVTLEWITTDETPGLSSGSLLAFGALVGMPLIGAALGFLAGFCAALIYNVIAPLTPWLKINVK